MNLPGTNELAGHVYTTGYSVESVMNDVNQRLADDHSAYSYTDSERDHVLGYFEPENLYKVTVTIEKVQ